MPSRPTTTTVATAATAASPDPLEYKYFAEIEYIDTQTHLDVRWNYGQIGGDRIGGYG